MRKQKKLGLSLRGGAGRASGYIGVFKALRDADIQVDYLIGSSMGSILGSLYAANFTISDMIEFSQLFQLKKMISFESIVDLSLFGDRKFQEEAKDVFRNMHLEDLKIPMYIQSTNLKTRKCEVFNKGPIYKLLSTSCAFPFYMPPVEYNGQYYIDGDITAGYGADYLRKQGADVVMGLSAGKGTSDVNHSSLISRFLDPILIAAENYKNVDLQAHPIDIHIDNLGLDAATFCYDRIPQLIDNAYEVTMTNMPEIKDKLEIKNQLFYSFNRGIKNLQNKIN